MGGQLVDWVSKRKMKTKPQRGPIQDPAGNVWCVMKKQLMPLIWPKRYTIERKTQKRNSIMS